MRTRLIVMMAASMVLAGCATTEPEPAWAPRADADLAADQAACRNEARGVDIRGGGGTDNESYNNLAAMAGHYDRQNARGGAEQRIFAAVRDSCMIRRGWTRAE